MPERFVHLRDFAPQFERDIEAAVAELRSRVLPSDLGWLGGIVDGEGCLTVHRTKRPKGGWYYRLYLFVVNCDPRIVDKCQEIAVQMLGKKASYVGTGRPQSRNAARIYRWETGGEPAIALLMVLRPFVVGKRDHIDLAIRLQERLRLSRTMMSAGQYGSYELSDQEIDKREVMYREMRALNVRGKDRELRLSAFVVN